MKYHPCDQVAADTLDAANEFRCSLDVKIVIGVMERVAERYRPRAEQDFEEILDTALDRFEPLTDVERHAYKLALGKIYNRRVQSQRKTLRHLDIVRPFAPR